MAKTVYQEGKWKCTEIDLSSDDPCNHENPGPALMCEKCHRHRPKDVQFYLPKGSKAVIDKKSLEAAKAGANWKCMNCNYDNVASDFHCVHCKTIRDESYEKWINLGGELKTKKYAAGQAPTAARTATANTSASSNSKKNWKRYLKIAGIAVGAFLFLWLIYVQFFKTSSLEVEVSGFSWEREIVIEESRTVSEEGWDIPPGGRQTSRRKKQSGTKEVYDHTEWDEEPVYEEVQVGTRQVECGSIDKGNGYFETQYCDEPIYESQQVDTRKVERKVYRDEPVYDYWYTYKIDRWFEDRSPQSAGNDQLAAWPNYQLSSRERVGDKYETYTVHLKPLTESKFSSFEYDLPESEWLKLKIGDKRIAKVKKSGKVVGLEMIK
jgi:hypothetical protein